LGVKILINSALVDFLKVKKNIGDILDSLYKFYTFGNESKL